MSFCSPISIREIPGIFKAGLVQISFSSFPSWFCLQPAIITSELYFFFIAEALPRSENMMGVLNIPKRQNKKMLWNISTTHWNRL